MAKDVTAILLPAGQLDEAEIRRAVRSRGHGDVFLRIAPLPSIGLTQVEVQESHDGLPCEDPELVKLLSKGGRAAFVHVNHTASQAIVHYFVDGAAQEGLVGAPDEKLTAKLGEALGRELTLDQITAADDGSRLGIGIASSHVVALLGEVELAVPVGMPTDMNSFRFHDRGLGVDEEDERMALFAFDPRALEALWAMGGQALGERIQAAPPGRYGALDAVRGRVIESLAALGDRSPAQAELKEVPALELCALEAARAFAGGDNVSYWDERVLPMFALSDGDPVFDPAELEDLDDETDSLLHAMVEVLPWAAPPGGEGPLLSLVGPDELLPLAPWARAGEEYRGSIFVLTPERLLAQVRALDGQKLKDRVEKFERAWYRASRPGQPEGDPYERWRRAKSEDGEKDTERFLRDWTELRILLELSALNRLTPALFFYEGV